MNLVVFDIETTGLSPTRDSIIQIAALKLHIGSWEQSEMFATLMRPPHQLPSYITRLTSITNEQVKAAPSPVEALVRFSRFVGEDTTLVAHYGPRFDMPFVRESCVRHGISTRQAHCIDSRDLSKQIWGGRGGHDLDTIASRLQLNTSGIQRHDARGDVKLLAEAFRQMWDKITARGSVCSLAPVEGVIPSLA